MRMTILSIYYTFFYMFLKREGSLSWLQFELLSEIPGLVHGVFSRQGGVSLPPFDALNVSVAQGDRVEAVQENCLLIQRALHLPSLVSMQQIHGNDIHLADQLPSTLPICDGLMTDKRGLGLMAAHGDCQIAIFYDPIHSSLAVVHAGWRGQVKQIYRQCIQKMAACFGSKPEELLVCISPSLGPSRSEFRNYKTELSEEFWPFEETFQHFNLWEVARYQLEQSGVLPHHIEIAHICTYTQSADYFSYRRDKVTGRNATVAGLF